MARKGTPVQDSASLFSVALATTTRAGRNTRSRNRYPRVTCSITVPGANSSLGCCNSASWIVGSNGFPLASMVSSPCSDRAFCRFSWTSRTPSTKESSVVGRFDNPPSRVAGRPPVIRFGPVSSPPNPGSPFPRPCRYPASPDHRRLAAGPALDPQVIWMIRFCSWSWLINCENGSRQPPDYCPARLK